MPGRLGWGFYIEHLQSRSYAHPPPAPVAARRVRGTLVSYLVNLQKGRRARRCAPHHPPLCVGHPESPHAFILVAAGGGAQASNVGVGWAGFTTHTPMVAPSQ